MRNEWKTRFWQGWNQCLFCGGCDWNWDTSECGARRMTTIPEETVDICGSCSGERREVDESGGSGLE